MNKSRLVTAAVSGALAGALLGLSACAPANPSLTAPVETFAKGTQSEPITAKVQFKPAVDILFVVDNSDSMIKHQENLKANINRFVEAFEKSKKIDFHIGVTSIYDSSRYGQTINGKAIAIPHKNGQLYSLAPAVMAPQATNAQLSPVASPEAPAALSANFVTRETPDYKAVLGNTLKIGTIPYAQGGPEIEELFSPVMAAIDGQNIGFIRPEAHLAVILISDADDISIAPSRLVQELALKKNNDLSMVSTFGVLALDGCKRDVGFTNSKTPNVNVLEFLKATGGHKYNLCDSKFGDKLAEAGRIIEQSTAQKVRIDLDRIPQAGTLKVSIAGTGEDVAYQYDANEYSITISSDAMDNQPADAQIEVSYIPVDPRRLGTGRVKNATKP